MMYPSHVLGIYPYDHEGSVTVDTAVLVKIRTDKNGKKVPLGEDEWRIQMIPKVSPKDAEFFKTFYTWDQARADRYQWKPAKPGTGP
jgi:hypothetical protein